MSFHWSQLVSLMHMSPSSSYGRWHDMGQLDLGKCLLVALPYTGLLNICKE